MMEGLRQWLLTVTAAAMLASVAQALMPEGAVKQVGRLVCGLMLLGAVLSPFGGVDVTDFSALPRYDDVEAELREEMEGRMKQDIEGRLAAYSEDKGAELGLDVAAQVDCAADGSGNFLPRTVVLTVEPGRDAGPLADTLAEELGLERSAVVIREGGT